MGLVPSGNLKSVRMWIVVAVCSGLPLASWMWQLCCLVEGYEQHVHGGDHCVE